MVATWRFVGGQASERSAQSDRRHASVHVPRFAITSAANLIAVGGLRTYCQGRADSPGGPIPHSDTGERVTPVLEFPSRDGLVVQAIRVAYEPGRTAWRDSEAA
jgi:hypothetical protein